MKRADIQVGAEYAVVIGHLRAGTAAGAEGLRRATVTGWTAPKYRGDTVEAIVTLAEPYQSQWGFAADNGKTVFKVPTRKVIATWAEHEPAATAREQDEQRRKQAHAEKQARIQAEVEELRSLIPADLLPSWLAAGAYEGGRVTTGELLAIIKAMR